LLVGHALNAVALGSPARSLVSVLRVAVPVVASVCIKPQVPSMSHSQSLPVAQCPNPSVKGTSCGKPQAAPYVER
jgi:hypothetical protein